MTKNEMQEIVGKLRYKDWKFKIGEKDSSLFLQIIFEAPDNYTGQVEQQNCRKWTLSEFMVASEIVETAWAAVQRAELHEAGEQFWMLDEATGNYVLPYCPHFDIYARVELARNKRFDTREEPAKGWSA